LIVSAIFHYYEGETKTPENILQKEIENSDNRNALFAVKELLERKYSKPLLHDCRKTNWRQSSVHVSSQQGGMYLIVDEQEIVVRFTISGTTRMIYEI
jgi:hypothetical protein